MSEYRRSFGAAVTYQDVLDAPEHMVAEIICGQLHLHPRPSTRHLRAAGKLFSRLDRSFDEGEDGPGAWWILEEPELHLGTDVLVPDLCGWRRERLAAVPDAAFIDVTPDWVCEVLSPSTRSTDLTIKRDRYARQGVRYLWLIEPETRVLEVFERAEDGWTLALTGGDNDTVRAPPFDAVALYLSTLWLAR